MVLIKNKKGHEIIISAIVFLVLWLISSLVWSIWLDDIAVPIVGAITSGMVVGGINFAINLK